MDYQKKRAVIAGYLEYAYLFLFGLMVAYLFHGITAFYISWDSVLGAAAVGGRIISNVLLDSPYYLISAVVILRYLIQEEYDVRKLVLSGLLFLGGRYLWVHSAYETTFLVFLFILGARDIPFRKIIKVYFVVITSLLLVTIGCALAGLIDNYTYVRSDGTVRMAFGIAYPTNFAAVVFFQVLCWWYIRKKKTTYLEAAIILGISYLLSAFCDARCSSYGLVGVAVVICWQRFWTDRRSKQGREYQMNPVGSFLLTLAHPVAAIGIILMTVFYTGQSVFLNKINILITNRLALGRKALDIYGINIWGRSVKLYSNAGGQSDAFYFYIDSSYVKLAVMYGLVTMGLVLLAFLLIGCKARAKKDWVLLWILVFVAAQSVIEQHLIDLAYCPFIIALFADTGGTENG